MNVISTEKAPGAIGPYSQGFEVNGFVFTSGQIPVNPANGEVPEGIAAQAEQSCKNVGAILEAASWLTWAISPHSTRFTQSTSLPSPPEAA